eukprot:CAMPEP_0195017456 /NCGR_PEP_ID=MMETSP0326_2-20130528/27479_1 /TAXON_ID=2866 ORGANISM="Crypthecodinium cohnii, Strain Seligo" /NCGR_SAMPLE_ID=MMETSP0326_2 /ASSEMBLY_ACC=CAM_ASM_000348 /LENGTH=31 /DNA_ID= /DNA_START= /DNA_END= /DNA_ORIENTATION=
MFEDVVLEVDDDVVLACMLLYQLFLTSATSE